MNFRFPIFLDVTGKNCLVTGEGFEVAGKVQSLVDSGAAVTYINEDAVPAIQELATLGLLDWQQRAFQERDLDGRFLVISDRNENHEIFQSAEQRGILCNCVDDPENCRFSFGSLHRQGDLTIAISTNGWAPAVAVRLRQRFEKEVGSEYGVLLRLLKEIRPEITNSISDFATRRDLWYRIVDSNVLDLLRANNEDGASQLIRGMLDKTINSILRSDISGDAERH